MGTTLDLRPLRLRQKLFCGPPHTSLQKEHRGKSMRTSENSLKNGIDADQPGRQFTGIPFGDWYRSCTKGCCQPLHDHLDCPSGYRSLPFYDVNYTMRHHPGWNCNFVLKDLFVKPRKPPEFVQLDWWSHKLVAMSPDELRKKCLLISVLSIWHPMIHDIYSLWHPKPHEHTMICSRSSTN